MRKTITTLGLCTLAIAFTGCSTWNKSSTKSKESPWSISKFWKKEYQQPQSIAVIWAPDTLSIPGKPLTRGFGGRIYFYNEKSQAVPVDGDLVVHGYLKHSRKDQSEQVAADKTFAFTAEQLTSHFSPSEIGASYSIWIPWDAADGLRAEITLIPTFKGKDGTIVQGTPAKVNLPGKADVADESAKRGLMQTVSYSQSSIPTNPGTDASQEKMRTTTINVPSNSTISKNKQIQAYTLGAQPAATLDNQSNSGAGVSIGGGASEFRGSSASGMMPNHGNLQPISYPSTTVSPSQTPAGSLPSTSPGSQIISPLQPGSQPVPQINPLGLTKSPIANAFPKAVTIPPPSKWVERTSEVSPASFTSESAFSQRESAFSQERR